jgi:arginine decarboxylase
VPPTLSHIFFPKPFAIVKLGHSDEKKGMPPQCRIKLTMKMDQTKAPFWELVNNYTQVPHSGFHTPGHRGGFSLGAGWCDSPLWQWDLTEIVGLDWEKALDEAQRLAADFYLADGSFFLVQGATQGILATLLGCFQPGDTVLVARNCHLSVLNGLILADLNPVYLPTAFLPEWGVPSGVAPATLKEAVRAYPDCKGLIITNPTYQGIATRLAAYRECLGDRILVVDEAHGGYLEWSGFDGCGAYRVADVWIHGTHKMLGSVTQTGMLHYKTGRIRPGALRRGLALVTTTSPSFILLAALDVNRRFLAERGRTLFGKRLPLVEELRAILQAAERLRLLTAAGLPPVSEGIVDPWKLTFSGWDRGFSGYQIAAFLQKRYRIAVEYADLYQITCFIAPWQSGSDLEALNRALLELARQPAQTKRSSRLSWPQGTVSRPVLPPRAAGTAPAQAVPWRQAAGRIAAGWAAPYPPGIPLWTPGEVITAAALAWVTAIVAQGGAVRGLDARNGLIQCIEEQ